MSILAYAGDGLIHLTDDPRHTLCGRNVYWAPEVPFGAIPPLSCPACYAAELARRKRVAL